MLQPVSQHQSSLVFAQNIGGKGDFQAPASLFDALWSICVTFALHSASCRSISVSFPPLITILTHSSIYCTQSPYKLPPIRMRFLQRQGIAITSSREDFHMLQHPFTSPSLPLTEKSFPLFEAGGRKVSLYYSPQLVTHHPQTWDCHQCSSNCLRMTLLCCLHRLLH